MVINMKKRIVSLVLAFLMLLSSLLSMVSCSSGKQTVMTIGDYKVSYDLLRYFVMNYMNGYEGLTAEDFAKDEKLQNQLYDNVIVSLSEFAAYSILADEYDVNLTSDEKKEIKQMIKDGKKEYESNKAYKEDMEKNFITEAVLKEIYTSEAKFNSLYEILTNDKVGIFKSDVETVDADIEAGNFFSAEYIVLYYDKNNADERKKVLEDILERAKNGEGMQELMGEAYSVYRDHIAYEYYPTFTYNEKKEQFEETVVNLKIGEYSDIVDMGSSYMIVHRKALDMEYIDTNYNTIIAQYLAREFFGYIEDYASKLEVKFKDKYKDLKMWEMQ